MRRIAFYLSEPWRSFICLLQVVLLTGFSLPASAMPATSARSRTGGAHVLNDAGTLSSLRMSLYQFQTKMSLASKAVVSALNPPSEFDRLRAQFEESLVASGPTTAQEDKALLQALRAYRDRAVSDDLTALNVFLSDYPRSAWRVGLLTNLGLAYYHYGYFSKAIASFDEAWKTGRILSDPSSKPLVDRAVGELLRMHARIGHADEVEAILKDLETHPVTGPATEAMDGAKQGLWKMRNEPGVAYLCGPMALKNLLISTGAKPGTVEFLNAVRSGRDGFALSQVAQLATQAHLSNQLIFRKPGQPVPVPSIIHWKVSHFAAIVGEENGRYHIQDPTFGTDLVVTKSALDSEASGYFLIAKQEGRLPWRNVKLSEAASIHGMGYTGTNNPTSTTNQDDTTSDDNRNTDESNQDNNENDGTTGDNGNCGLCAYSITEMLVSVRLSDTPVGYRPPVGPAMYTTLTYNQREASQPATFGWFNVSQKWTLNWMSYIQDDPTSPGNNVTRIVGGGGSIAYSGYNSGRGAFTPETRNAAVLVRTSATPITYQRTRANGGVEIFSSSNGATSFPRRIFLTKIIDPAGNTVTLNYDSQVRLVSITDATGRNTTFTYGLSSQPLLVTAITDPFGRSAQLIYDASNRLSQITDVLGLTSRFTYDSSSLINSLTTPYGTTSFVYGASGNQRFVNATDPLGHTERVEYNEGQGFPAFSDQSNTVPAGIQNPFNQYLDGRDTYIWDKHAYAVAGRDLTKARIKHWTHLASNTNVTANTIESIKNPLENRIWYNYPGQAGSGLGTAVSGTLDKRTNIARVLDDGTTQLTQYAYNSAGKVTSIIDPLGRQTTFQYAANNIDLTSIQQKTSTSGFSTIAQFTYNTQHRPLTYTDAAGKTTTYVYNAAGQLLQKTDALGEITQYQYDGLGYLTRIINANNQTAASFTYDSYGRVSTRTDSEGYALNYAYDSFDRLTTQTFPDTTTRLYSYNKLDLASVTDRQGRTTGYAYDAVRNLVDIQDPLSRHTTFGYYENNKLKTLTDPNNNATTWNIDIESRNTAKVYADGKTFTNAYENTTSRLKSLTDPLSQVKKYTYALDDQITGITYMGAVNLTPNVTFAYDPYFRRITSMTDGTGTRQYQYYTAGVLGALNLKQESGPYTNDAIAYQYDVLGRLTQRTVDTAPETFSYDTLGRESNHTDALGSFDLTYLGQTSQLTSRMLRRSTLGTSWSYDTNQNDRRLKDITNPGATRSYHYTTTPENLISQITESAASGSAFAPQTWNYAYDNSDRLLTGLSSGGSNYTYAYDAADNIASSRGALGSNTASYNAVNQITSFGGQTFIYDANGNLTDDGVRTYKWDAENRLVNAAYKTQPSRTTSVAYDGLGRRNSIAVSNGALFTETRYLWCGTNLCQARSATDAVIRRYYREGELVPASGTLLYYVKDNLGSVRDVLAVQNGSRVAAFDYDTYGNPSQTNGRVSTDFRYAGLFFEGNSGLYLARFRAYDPRIGRWLDRDPLGERYAINIYGYGNGSPTNFIDPSGLAGTPPTGVPMPPENIPGGPWQWSPNPQNSRGGDFIGPKPPGGGQRMRCTYAPPGQNNPDPYWKTTDPTGAQQRYDVNGNPITPEQAHPGPKPQGPPNSESGPEPPGLRPPVQEPVAPEPVAPEPIIPEIPIEVPPIIIE